MPSQCPSTHRVVENVFVRVANNRRSQFSRVIRLPFTFPPACNALDSGEVGADRKSPLESGQREKKNRLGIKNGNRSLISNYPVLMPLGGSPWYGRQGEGWERIARLNASRTRNGVSIKQSLEREREFQPLSQVGFQACARFRVGSFAWFPDAAYKLIRQRWDGMHNSRKPRFPFFKRPIFPRRGLLRNFLPLSALPPIFFRRSKDTFPQVKNEAFKFFFFFLYHTRLVNPREGWKYFSETIILFEQ